MNLKYLVLLFVLSFVTLEIQSQSNIYIVDKESHLPVSFATLQAIKNKEVFFSDYEGKIDIPAHLKSNVFLFKHISYPEIILQIDRDTLFVKLKSNEIPEITIIQEDAERIMTKAIQQINHLFKKEFIAYSYYQQSHIENNKVVFYVDAIHHLKVEQNRFQFSINALRRSNNYERNPVQHGDHLYDILLENPIYGEYVAWLNPKLLINYDWKIINSNQEFYYIEFKMKAKKEATFIEGVVKVNRSNYAIEKINYHEYNNPKVEDEYETNWLFMNGYYEVEFQSFGDFYYPLKIDKWYNHEVLLERDYSITDYYLLEQFHWELKSLDSTNSSFKNHSNLYSIDIPYNGTLWEDYPVDSQIIEDLSGVIPLEEQFKKD